MSTEPAATSLTSVIHRSGYPAIAPTRPELSQAGRTVLIVGGGTNIGKAIAENFVRAAATTVIIIGRRENVLQEAVAELEAVAQSAGSPTKVLSRAVDATATAQVDALWAELAGRGLTVDVLVLNSVKFSSEHTLLGMGTPEVWSHFEANVKAPLYMAELFSKQPGEKPRFLQFVSTAAINMSSDPLVAVRPIYTLTKLASTYAFSLIADTVQSDKMLVISFHPGLLYSSVWKDAGVPEDAPFFDSPSLPGQFSVWAASEEARFLHGRFVFTAWDVVELAGPEFAKKFAADPDYLRPGIIGLSHGGHPAE